MHKHTASAALASVMFVTLVLHDDVDHSKVKAHINSLFPIKNRSLQHT